MSEKIAKSHTQPSNRAKYCDQANRKVVYRSTLDNPYRVQWPAMASNLQTSILTLTVHMLGGIADYHISRERHSRKRSQVETSSTHRASKRQHLQSGLEANTLMVNTNDMNPAELSSARMSAALDITDGSATAIEEPALVPPPILKHLTIGINEVTRLLEGQIAPNRQTVIIEGTQSTASQDTARSRLLLVCRGDIDPPLLVQHIPHLVAAYNSRRVGRQQSFIWLVPLPRGAEVSLAEATGFRRASVLAIDSSAPDFSSLSALLEKVPLLSAPWLTEPSRTPPTLIPTHVKQLRTTAPKDMKAAKGERARGRAAAKERRRKPKTATTSSVGMA